MKRLYEFLKRYAEKNPDNHNVRVRVLDKVIREASLNDGDLYERYLKDAKVDSGSYIRAIPDEIILYFGGG